MEAAVKSAHKCLKRTSLQIAKETGSPMHARVHYMQANDHAILHLKRAVFPEKSTFANATDEEISVISSSPDVHTNMHVWSTFRGFNKGCVTINLLLPHGGKCFTGGTSECVRSGTPICSPSEKGSLTAGRLWNSVAHAASLTRCSFRENR